MTNIKNYIAKSKILLWLPVIFAFTLAGCGPAVMAPAPTPTSPLETPTPDPDPTPTPTSEVIPPTGVEPGVSVSDQDIVEGTVTVDEVISEGPGWIVIHIMDEYGAPGPVIGYAPVEDGDNLDVVVEIDTEMATSTLFAMLHIDAGEIGEYEFPGADVPVMVDGQVVMQSFQVVLDEPEPVSPELEEEVVSETEMVSVRDTGFSPPTLRIPIGTTVIWGFGGDLPHTVTADDGSFDSGILGPGDTFEFTFTEAGSYPYFCSLHGGPGGIGMAGAIVVTQP